MASCEVGARERVAGGSRRQSDRERDTRTKDSQAHSVLTAVRASAVQVEESTPRNLTVTAP